MTAPLGVWKFDGIRSTFKKGITTPFEREGVKRKVRSVVMNIVLSICAMSTRISPESAPEDQRGGTCMVPDQ